MDMLPVGIMGGRELAVEFPKDLPKPILDVLVPRGVNPPLFLVDEPLVLAPKRLRAVAESEGGGRPSRGFWVAGADGVVIGLDVLAENIEPPNLGAADNEKLSGVLEPEPDELFCFPEPFIEEDKGGLGISSHDMLISPPPLASAGAVLESRRMSVLLVDGRGFETGTDW